MLPHLLVSKTGKEIKKESSLSTLDSMSVVSHQNIGSSCPHEYDFVFKRFTVIFLVHFQILIKIFLGRWVFKQHRLLHWQLGGEYLFFSHGSKAQIYINNIVLLVVLLSLAGCYFLREFSHPKVMIYLFYLRFLLVYLSSRSYDISQYIYHA